MGFNTQLKFVDLVEFMCESWVIEYIETSLLKIDKAIAQIQKEIDLIKEYQINLISGVVTGQINVR